jgi:hypothetical protein
MCLYMVEPDMMAKLVRTMESTEVSRANDLPHGKRSPDSGDTLPLCVSRRISFGVLEGCLLDVEKP